MTKTNIRKLLITGVHHLDLVMYCAFVLQVLGHRVLVCDRTKAGMLQSAICKPDKPMDLVCYGEVDFAFSELAVLDERYDYIIYMQDFENTDIINECRQVLVCDGIRTHINAMLAHMEAMLCDRTADKCDSILLYRDLYYSYGMEYIKRRMPERIAAGNLLVLHHDCMDEAVYQRLQFQPFIRMAEISSDMDHVIRELLCHAAQLDTIAVKRGMKLAKRRRIG